MPLMPLVLMYSASAVVQAHRVLDPAGARVRTDHDEEPADGPLRHASFAIPDLDAAQMLSTRELDHL